MPCGRGYQLPNQYPFSSSSSFAAMYSTKKLHLFSDFFIKRDVQCATVSKKGNTKKCSNYHTVAFISHARKECSKFSKPGFNSTWTVNFQMFKLDLERQRNQRSNCQHPLDHWKSKRVPEKHLFLFHWLCQSLWLAVSQQIVENSETDENTRPPGKSVCRSRSNS